MTAFRPEAPVDAAATERDPPERTRKMRVARATTQRYVTPLRRIARGIFASSSIVAEGLAKSPQTTTAGIPAGIPVAGSINRLSTYVKRKLCPVKRCR
jgi:hypothetical protein